MNQSNKTRWTLERCRSIARKFENEVIWMSCKPASYKAAVARGFLQVCLEAQNADRLPQTRTELRQGVTVIS